jgi:hypothetical protein
MPPANRADVLQLFPASPIRPLHTQIMSDVCFRVESHVVSLMACSRLLGDRGSGTVRPNLSNWAAGCCPIAAWILPCRRFEVVDRQRELWRWLGGRSVSSALAYVPESLSQARRSAASTRTGRVFSSTSVQAVRGSGPCMAHRQICFADGINHVSSVSPGLAATPAAGCSNAR